MDVVLHELILINLEKQNSLPKSYENLMFNLIIDSGDFKKISQ